MFGNFCGPEEIGLRMSGVLSDDKIIQHRSGDFIRLKEYFGMIELTLENGFQIVNVDGSCWG